MGFHPFSNFNIFQTIHHIGTVYIGRSVYNIKSLALTLNFPQAFKDAVTKRRVKFPRKFKHPEYYDIPKPHPWKSIIFKLWYHILSLESLNELAKLKYFSGYSNLKMALQKTDR